MRVYIYITTYLLMELVQAPKPYATNAPFVISPSLWSNGNPFGLPPFWSVLLMNSPQGPTVLITFAG